MWSGGRYSSIQARETTPNRFDIYASSTIRCPTSSTAEWTRVGQGVTGPVLFTTTVDEQQAKPGDVLGLCDTDGSVTRYRGSISVVNDSTNTNRVVNDVRVENYLRGVVSFEVSVTDAHVHRARCSPRIVGPGRGGNIELVTALYTCVRNNLNDKEPDDACRDR